jgi:hypothetical protein
MKDQGRIIGASGFSDASVCQELPGTDGNWGEISPRQQNQRNDNNAGRGRCKKANAGVTHGLPNAQRDTPQRMPRTMLTGHAVQAQAEGVNPCWLTALGSGAASKVHECADGGFQLLSLHTARPADLEVLADSAKKVRWQLCIEVKQQVVLTRMPFQLPFIGFDQITHDCLA